MKIVILDSCLMYGLSCKRYIENWSEDNDESTEVTLVNSVKEFVSVECRGKSIFIMDAEWIKHDEILNYLIKVRKYNKKLKILLSSALYNDLSFPDFHRMKINGLLYKGYSENEFKKYFGRVFIRSEYFDYTHIASQLKAKYKFDQHLEQKVGTPIKVNKTTVSNRFMKMRIRNNVIQFA